MKNEQILQCFHPTYASGNFHVTLGVPRMSGDLTMQYLESEPGVGGETHSEIILRFASKISHGEESRVMYETQGTENDCNLD